MHWDILQSQVSKCFFPHQYSEDGVSVPENPVVFREDEWTENETSEETNLDDKRFVNPAQRS